ncbi:MAG: alcohol dehydrogenase catalytic domain-containing protein [Elusimicrobiota bacterium]
MKALLYEGPRKVRLQDVGVPAIGEGEVLLAVEACALSASDVAKIDSNIRGLPVSLGHEVSGRIAELGPGVEGFRQGARVVVSPQVPCLECHYCRKGDESMCREFKRSGLEPGGFSQFVRVSARHVERVMLPIPAKTGFVQAAMTEPVARCLRNVRRLGIGDGDCAIVVGLGFTGLLAVQALLRRDVRVLGLDADPARVRLAQKFGVEHAYTGKDGRTQQIIGSLTQNRGADAVVFTDGPPSLVSRRLDWVRDGGIVNLSAAYDGDPAASASLDFAAVSRREITVTSGHSPSIADLREARRLIASGGINVAPFAKHTFPLDRYEEALRQLRGHEIVKAVLLPQKCSTEAA